MRSPVIRPPDLLIRAVSVVLLLLALSPRFLWAAEVLQVSTHQKLVLISNDPAYTWKKGDTVCIYRELQRVACGKVTKPSAKGGIVTIVVPYYKIEKGMLAKSASDRELANAEQVQATASVKPTSSQFDWNLGGGLAAGPTYFFPVLDLERRIGSHFAIGIVPFYDSSAESGASASLIGGYLTVNYYTVSPFRGFWGRLGAGPAILSVNLTGVSDGSGGTTNISGTSTSLSAIGTIGYRFGLTSLFDVGIGLGGMYYKSSSSTGVSVSISGVLFTGTADVAVNF